MTMEPTLDQVREELASIHEELLVLPADAFDRRAQLKSRQNELRQLSHELADGATVSDPAVLKAAFARLQQLRDQVVASYVTPQATAVGFGGAETDFTNDVNRAIDAGEGLDEIEARLESALKAIRAAKGDDDA